MDSPFCLLLRRHKWISLSPNIALWACQKCGKVKAQYEQPKGR